MLAELKRPLNAALLIDVDFEVIVKRLTSRRMCKECGHIGSVADAACPACGGEMYQRDDDNEATVRNRLDVYEKSTAPLIDYYRGCDLLVSIDGDRDSTPMSRRLWVCGILDGFSPYNVSPYHHAGCGS